MGDFYGLVPLIKSLDTEKKNKAKAVLAEAEARKEHVRMIFFAIETIVKEGHNSLLKFEIKKAKIPAGQVFIVDVYDYRVRVYLEEILNEIQDVTTPEYKKIIMNLVKRKIETKYANSHS
ncbi:hypothetical protein [Paenibacillus sp. FSL H8-0259]|uniref:hypothetical protein n=1 Tax=Paenibacillus sp. FSL H8-0259 TaxID=1920423 RepID=UPI00096DB52E|nr:hypothetical protein [Paenibacillus sp. FSL H8-0259]OMF21878.1 hypothetical protein BK132_31605 [Paenibacillus sp. FSL H8-0259]